MADPLLRMENIRKTFPGVVANDQVNLEIERGEIHALLGENGAGKTTLMNVLYGIYRPDGGKIVWKGQEVDIHSSRDAIALGIGMVHQHFMLVPPFTVTENVVLGLEQPRAPLIDAANAEAKILELGETYGLPIDPKAYVWQLPVGVQQRVEIIKALYRRAELLILDEPTAVLTPGEVKDLFDVLRSMTAKGLSIIFITHKLEEVMAATDRVTILRDGMVIDTVRTADTSRRQLARMMVGRDVVERLDKPPLDAGRPILQVNDLHALNNRELPALKGVSFDVCAGEILGVAGVDGNGQSQLAEVITGLRKATGGTFKVDGVDATNAQPARPFRNASGAHPRGPAANRPGDGFFPDGELDYRDVLPPAVLQAGLSGPQIHCKSGPGAAEVLRRPHAEREVGGQEAIGREPAKGGPGARNEPRPEAVRGRAADARA